MPEAPIDQAKVLAAVREFRDPETGRGIVQMEQVRDVRVEADSLVAYLGVNDPFGPAVAGNLGGVGTVDPATLSGDQAGHDRPQDPRAAAAEAGHHRPGGEKRHRGGIGQRRRGEEHHRRQRGAGLGSRRLESRPVGCRRVRPEHSALAGTAWPAGTGRRKQNQALRQRRNESDVDGFLRAVGRGGGVARADAARRDHANAARYRVGRAGLFDHRSCRRAPATSR